MRNLGALDGIYSQSLGINDLGQASGFALDAVWAQHPVIWNPDSTATVLDSPGGWVEARDLNEAGEVVGVVGTMPVRWSAGGEPQELGHVIALGGAHAINSAGDICGNSDEPGGQAYTEASIWGHDGSFRALGVKNGGNSDALDLNDAGEAVGWAETFLYGPTVAIYWSPAGEMINLNAHAPPGWELQEAVAINARGDIAGVGRDSSGVRQPFVLWKIDASAVDGSGPGGSRSAGREPEAQAARLRLAPNPSSGRVYLRVDGRVGGPASVRVIDVRGRQVDAFPLESAGGSGAGIASRWLGGLPRGHYVMVLDVDHRPVASEKILLLPAR